MSDALPASSVPAAFDNKHLYSPTSSLAPFIDYRPGDQYEPLPKPPADPAAWRAWWQIARTPTPDYLGLKPGDDITIQVPSGPCLGHVLTTSRCGALIRTPMPDGADKPHTEMYVRRRNQHGHWY